MMIPDANTKGSQREISAPFVNYSDDDFILMFIFESVHFYKKSMGESSYRYKAVLYKTYGVSHFSKSFSFGTFMTKEEILYKLEVYPEIMNVFNSLSKKHLRLFINDNTPKQSWVYHI